MKWFTFFLMFGGLLMATGTFSPSFSVADETTDKSPQVTDQMEDEYKIGTLLPEDGENFTEEGDPNDWYDEELLPIDDDNTEETVGDPEKESEL